MIKLMQGDCLERMKEIPDGSVDMILTDVPYLVSRKTNFKTIKDYTKIKGETEYSCMSFGDWDKDFDLKLYVEECMRILKEGKSMVIWSAWQQLNEIDSYVVDYLPKSKSGSSRIGIWEKSNPSVFNMQRMAIQPFEFFIWHRKGSNWTFNNQQEKYIDKSGTERQIPERHYFRESCVQGGHPTAKPLSIFESLIKTYTNKGDVVFDGCVGGGTTAIACENTGRKFIAIEKDMYVCACPGSGLLLCGSQARDVHVELRGFQDLGGHLLEASLRPAFDEDIVHAPMPRPR